MLCQILRKSLNNGRLLCYNIRDRQGRGSVNKIEKEKNHETCKDLKYKEITEHYQKRRMW